MPIPLHELQIDLKFHSIFSSIKMEQQQPKNSSQLPDRDISLLLGSLESGAPAQSNPASTITAPETGNSITNLSNLFQPQSQTPDTSFLSLFTSSTTTPPATTPLPAATPSQDLTFLPDFPTIPPGTNLLTEATTSTTLKAPKSPSDLSIFPPLTTPVPAAPPSQALTFPSRLPTKRPQSHLLTTTLSANAPTRSHRSLLQLAAMTRRLNDLAYTFRALTTADKV